MSTKERFGTLVWDAARVVQRHVAAQAGYGFAVGEVAAQAGVSKPTARKYLALLVEQGYVTEFVTPWGHKMYQVRREFRLGMTEGLK